jgi:hypothetical protein
MKTNRFTSKNLHLISAALLSLFLFVAPSRAGTVTGIVHNGTSNKPAAGIDVLLIQLQGTMQTVANTKTDADGRYHFDNPAIGNGPMLIRAVYRGVNFHQPLTPGMTTADVTVYEPTTNPQAMQVTTQLLVFQPNGEKLLVGEEFSIQNNLAPPAAFYKQDGNFEFTVPDGAEVSQVSAFGPSGMPVVQGTIDKGKGRYAIAYAFQPGQNGVRVSYEIPYAGNHATVHEKSGYDAQRMLLVVPPTMQLSSAGFNAAGQEQGFNVFTKDTVKAGTGVDIAISGTAPPPADNAGSGGGGAGGADQVNGRDSGVAIQTAPARLDDQKWILLGGLAAIFAVGMGILLRRFGPVLATAPAPAPEQGPGPRKRKGQRPAPVPEKPAPPVRAAQQASPVQQVNQEVNSSLDSLKDMLLRLELRRQAGNITEQEYVRERGRAEQLLRELVQS